MAFVFSFFFFYLTDRVLKYILFFFGRFNRTGLLITIFSVGRVQTHFFTVFAAAVALSLVSNMMNDIIIYVKYGTLSLQLSLSRTSGIGRVMAVYKDLCVSFFTSSPFANRKKLSPLVFSSSV